MKIFESNGSELKKEDVVFSFIKEQSEKLNIKDDDTIISYFYDKLYIYEDMSRGDYTYSIDVRNIINIKL